MTRRSTLVVDDQLVWVFTPSAVPAGGVMPASGGGLAELARRLDAELDAAQQQRLLARALDDFARAVALAGDDLPPLPFIGEPFGGQGGTD